MRMVQFPRSHLQSAIIPSHAQPTAAWTVDLRADYDTHSVRRTFLIDSGDKCSKFSRPIDQHQQDFLLEI